MKFGHATVNCWVNTISFKYWKDIPKDKLGTMSPKEKEKAWELPEYQKEANRVFFDDLEFLKETIGANIVLRFFPKENEINAKGDPVHENLELAWESAKKMKIKLEENQEAIQILAKEARKKLNKLKEQTQKNFLNILK